MRRAAVLLAATMITLSVAAAMGAPQDKWARGKVTAMAGDSITIDVKGEAMTFTVNPATEVVARGAGTKAREIERKTGGKPKLADLVKVGDNVEVSYEESGGAMVAKMIRGGVAARPATSKEGPQEIEGEVTEVSNKGFTVKPSSGDAMTFMADAKIRIQGHGLGTLGQEKKKAGQKMTITDAVGVGDTIHVTYTKVGDMNHATAVRVVRKKT